MRVRVRIPASAGNNGPGFDCLGLAYGLYNEVVLDTAHPDALEIEGEGTDDLARGEPNLVCRALEAFANQTGRAVPAHGLTLVNRIPFCRGLGGSAAAIVGGLVGADALTGAGLKREELLALALTVENHPDNVAAAIYGGAVLTVFEEGVGGPFTAVPIRVPSGWRAAVLIPDRKIPTREARAILPAEVPRPDAIFNHSRVGLLVAALLEDRPEHLGRAMEDRLHQPYRAALFPEMPELLAAARDAGAWGACLSGAGPAILALASPDQVERVCSAMEDEATRLELPARALVLDIPPEGAHAEVEQP